MMIRALIFDMDGLMVDTEPLYWDVARTLARNCGKEISDDTLRKMMGRSRIESMRIFAEACGIDSPTPEDLLVERETLMLDRYGRGIDPMPGLREILERFRGRLRFAVDVPARDCFIIRTRAARTPATTTRRSWARTASRAA